MASSRYYYNKMVEYSREKRECDELQEDYNRYEEKLKKLNQQLPNVKNFIDSSKSNFLNGGYVDNGKTLDNGELTNCSNIMNQSINDLTNIINKIEGKIEQLKNQSKKYKELYNDAEVDYRKALKREAEVGD